MFKRTNDVYNESTKRKDIISNKAKNQKFRSSNSLNLSYSNIEDSRNSAAVLVFFNKILQRLADIAQYFEFSFIYNINIVEETYRTEIDRKNKI